MTIRVPARPRARRPLGFAEAVYCAGKSPAQIAAILAFAADAGAPCC